VKRITSPPFFAPTFSAPTIARRVTPVQSVQKLCVPPGARRDGVPPGQRADAAPAGGSPLPDETCEKVGRAIFTLRISPREVGVLTPPLVSCVAAERRLAPVVTHMAVDMTGPEARAASLPPAPVNSRAAESKSPHDPPYLPSGPARQPGDPATSSRKPLTARHAVRATVPKDHAPATPSFRKTGAAQAGSHANGHDIFTDSSLPMGPRTAAELMLPCRAQFRGHCGAPRRRRPPSDRRRQPFGGPAHGARGRRGAGCGPHVVGPPAGPTADSAAGDAVCAGAADGRPRRRPRVPHPAAVDAAAVAALRIIAGEEARSTAARGRVGGQRSSGRTGVLAVAAEGPAGAAPG
jgi:hypothetical protein